MTCFHPRDAWLKTLPDGKQRLKLGRSCPGPGWVFTPIPCRQCVGCKYDRAVQIGIRSFHEASQYRYNCFITLTVSPKWLNVVFPDGSLRKSPFQNFMKRLRKYIADSDDIEVKSMITYLPQPSWHIGKWNPEPIRVLWCGEYGDKNHRPHYHACLYNFDFPDKKKAEMRNGIQYYKSEILNWLWSDPKTHESYGLARLGEVNMASSVYLGKYCSKRINFSKAKIDKCLNGFGSDKEQESFSVYCDRYFHPDTGVILDPEFVEFPRGFGLGRLFYEKHKDDMYHPISKDSCVHILRGGKTATYKVPEYYDRVYSVQYPEKYEQVKAGRVERAHARSDDNTPERLAVREELFKSRSRNNERNITYET